MEDIKQRLRTKEIDFDDVANTGFSLALNKKVSNPACRTPVTPRPQPQLYLTQQNNYFCPPPHQNHHLSSERVDYFDQGYTYSGTEGNYYQRGRIHFAPSYIDDNYFPPYYHDDDTEQDNQMMDENSQMTIPVGFPQESNDNIINYHSRKLRTEAQNYRKNTYNPYLFPVDHDEDTRMFGFNNDSNYYRKKSFNTHNDPIISKELFSMVKEDKAENSKKLLEKSDEKIYDIGERKYKKRKLDNEASKVVQTSAAEEFSGVCTSGAAPDGEKFDIHNKEDIPEDEDINWMKGIKGRSSKGKTLLNL